MAATPLLLEAPADCCRVLERASRRASANARLGRAGPGASAQAGGGASALEPNPGSRGSQAGGAALAVLATTGLGRSGGISAYRRRGRGSPMRRDADHPDPVRRAVREVLARLPLRPRASRAGEHQLTAWVLAQHGGS
jgi:hypothetical protein